MQVPEETAQEEKNDTSEDILLYSAEDLGVEGIQNKKLQT
jgi:hypothetical protein